MRGLRLNISSQAFFLSSAEITRIPSSRSMRVTSVGIEKPSEMRFLDGK
jgi:hypothetical protein